MKLKDSVILILAVIVAIVVGVFSGIKITENRNSVQSQNNNVDKKTDVVYEEIVDGYIDAIRLMDKYIVDEHDYFSEDDSSDELAFSSTKPTGYISFTNIEKTHSYQNNNSGCILTSDFAKEDFGEFVDFYSYEDVLKTKKELFGNDSKLERKNIRDNVLYIEEYDGFITGYACGGSGAFFEVLEHDFRVTDYKLDANGLYIYTSFKYKSLGPDDSIYEVSEKKKYTFKKQDTGYYMEKVEVIK